MTSVPPDGRDQTPGNGRRAHGGWIPDDAELAEPGDLNSAVNGNGGAANASSPGGGPGDGASGDGGDGERTLMYANVEDWVVDYLAPHTRRRLGGQTAWCAQWWNHEEAISVLTALWSAWEHLRYDGALGLLNWWLQYYYPAMDRLTSPDGGPFASCRREHVQLDPLPCDPAPPELRTDPAYADSV